MEGGVVVAMHELNTYVTRTNRRIAGKEALKCCCAHLLNAVQETLRHVIIQLRKTCLRDTGPDHWKSAVVRFQKLPLRASSKMKSGNVSMTDIKERVKSLKLHPLDVHHIVESTPGPLGVIDLPIYDCSRTGMVKCILDIITDVPSFHPH